LEAGTSPYETEVRADKQEWPKREWPKREWPKREYA
jgi:hypothetical protein